jgi:hypothetical protein
MADCERLAVIKAVLGVFLTESDGEEDEEDDGYLLGAM